MKRTSSLTIWDAGRAIGPKLEGKDISIRQVAPGRYEGEFEADDPGSYLFSVISRRGIRAVNPEVFLWLTPRSSAIRQQIDRFWKLSRVTSQTISSEAKLLATMFENELLTELLKVNTFDLICQLRFQSKIFGLGSCWLQPSAFTEMYSYVEWHLISVGSADCVGEFSSVKQLRTKPEERMSRLKSKKANIDKGLAEKQLDGRYQIPTSELRRP